MKKIFSVLLAIIIIFTAAGTSFTSFAEDTASETVITENEVTSDMPNRDDPGVIMYLCATANSLTGHVWLYFINNTDEPVTIGYIEMQPGQEMSVGRLRNTRKDGGGTYYNGEAMMAALDGKLDSLCKHTTSLKMVLDEEQINTVSEKIKSMNAYEMILFNCGIFAARVWNSVSSKKIVHFIFPMLTILFMNLLPGTQKGELRMKDPTEEGGIKPYKQTNNGVKEADVKSFNISCVNF